jgi:hypothetical protein
MRRIFYFSLFWFILSFLLTGSLFAQTNLLPNGDFETYAPAFWEEYNGGLSGVQLTWADDEAAPNPWAPAGVDVPSYRSFKVEKSSTTTDAAGWKSVNNADLYWNNASGNILYTLSFYAKTSGVNTNPSGQDAMIGVWYRFYASSALIGEQFVALDQTTANTDWTKYTGVLTVTSEPDEVYAYAVMEMNATGTVWFDNIDCGTDPWSMGIFNGDAETPVGWMYWTDSSMPNFASLVSDTVHSGNYSALLYEKDNESDEMVYYSAPIAAQPETWYKLGVWVNTDSVNNDPAWFASNVTLDKDVNRLGVCFFYHIGPDILHSWDLTGGDQFFYADQRNAATGWTHYIVVSKSPVEATGISIRARFNDLPTGYAWYDDFTIEPAEVVVSIENPATPISNLITNYNLLQNYPNPFNPETIIEYQVPERGQVELNIYNMLGQKIRTLVIDVMPAGTYQVWWNGKDDYGNQVATGVYLYQLRGKNALITKKMMLIK